MPASFPIPELGSEAIKNLSALLKAENYHKRPQPEPGSQETQGKLAALRNLYLYGKPVRRDEAENAIPPASLAAWLTAGLLAEEAGSIQALFQIQVYKGFLFITDLMPRLHPADMVLPIGPSGKYLANITIRRPVKTALDLGCGCGVQALLLSRHAERVTATDINPRALALTRLNAELNQVNNIECLLGSFFEPVGGRKFDLIVANLPYVISPESIFIYRDLGKNDDTPIRENIQQIPLFLNEGGYAHVMLNWLHSNQEPWWQPVDHWVAGRNMDSWLFYQNSMPPEHYADMWIVTDKNENPGEFAQIKKRWLKWYEEHGIQQIALGAITLRRRTASDSWRCSIHAGQINPGDLGAQVLDLFENQDYLADVKTPRDLLACRLARANIRLETLPDGACQASTPAGYLIQEKIEPVTARTIDFLDGRTTLASAIQSAAAGNSPPAASVQETAVREIYQLITLGMLKPVMGDIVLLFPPFLANFGPPPASISALYSSLRTQGYQAKTHDLNTRFYKFIMGNWPKLVDIFSSRLNDLLRRKILSIEEHRNLVFIALPLISYLINFDPMMVTLVTIEKVVNAFFFGSSDNSPSNPVEHFTQISKSVELGTEAILFNQFLLDFNLGNAQFVGMSLLSETQLRFSLLLSRILKKISPDVIIIAGGAYITEMVQTILSDIRFFDYFDYIVVQEGETALNTILNNHKNNQRVFHPNVFSRERCDPQNRTFYIEDIHSLPQQDFTCHDLSVHQHGKVGLPVYSSKGCSWKRCTFCCFGQIGRYRERDLTLVVDGMVKAYEATRINYFFLVDEDINPKRLNELADLIIARAPQPFQWFCQTRFYPKLDYELLARMKKSGCSTIDFGLESASPRILREINKGIDLDIVQRILRDCSAVGIKVYVNCMVGFPTETQSDAEETVAFLDKIRVENPALDMICNTAFVKIFKNSSFGKNSSEYHLTTLENGLSPVLKWQNPDWCENFFEKYQDHLIFSGKSSTGNKQRPPILSADPLIGLSHKALFIEQSKDLLGNTVGPFLIKINQSQFKSIPITTTMKPIVKILAGERLKLSDLKEFYRGYFSNHAPDKVLLRLERELQELHQQGVITYS